MKIERVEVFGVAIPLIGEYRITGQSTSTQRSAIVRITATGGRIGLGNVDPVDGYSEESVYDTLAALEKTFAPLLIGTDPTNIHLLLCRLNAAAAKYLDAKAAIEMACVDLTARLFGVPVYTYLGGAVRQNLRFNGWIGIVSPDKAAAEILEWKKRGFQSAKIKVGSDFRVDCDRIQAVREAVGSAFKLRIDANGGYDADTAIELARMVRPFGVDLFEQPVPADDIAGMARVRREANGMPIMADESVVDHASLIRVIRAGAADIVKLKLMKQGGFQNTRRMIATAEAAGIRCVVGHGFGLGVSTMAEIMLAATSTNVIDGLECVGPLKTLDDVVVNKLDIASGNLRLPAVSGLGVELDASKLERYVFEHFNVDSARTR